MQGASAESTFQQLIYSNKAMKVCQDERVNFTLCRATPAGRLADPSLCESKAKSLLTCYDAMIRDSECSSYYSKAFDCLESAHKRGVDIETSTVCARALDDYSLCGAKKA